MRVVAAVLALVLGVLPAFAAGGDAEKGKQLYQKYCTSCHGSSGKGDGPAGKALKTKPRDHTDGNYMKTLSDEHLADFITKGGAALGKSGLMPAWNKTLNPTDVQDLVAYIRTIGK